ncbi:MAG: hypothetical protein PHE84_15165 [bacterium]|nr:hypothetical protein [bacterium]
MEERKLLVKPSASRVGRTIQAGVRIVMWLGIVAMGLFFLGLDAIRIYIFKRF